MSEDDEKKSGLKDGKQTPVYRVLQPIVLSTDRQIYSPGAIVDLSHQTQAGIRWMIDNGLVETADGEPENVPAARAAPCKNC
jgi:hypothetical protein